MEPAGPLNLISDLTSEFSVAPSQVYAPSKTIRAKVSLAGVQRTRSRVTKVQQVLENLPKGVRYLGPLDLFNETYFSTISKGNVNRSAAAS